MPATEHKHRFSNPKRVRAQVQPAVDELKAAIAASGVNMNPPGVGGVPASMQPAAEEQFYPELAEVIGDEDDRVTLSAMLSQHAELSIRMAPIEKERKRLGELIKAKVREYGIERAQYQGIKVVYYETHPESLNAVKLLEAGVSSAIILACTDTKTVRNCKVTPAKESNAE